MSNYPPGVTGHEYAIAGPRDEYDDERTVEHDCDEERFEKPFTGDVVGTVIIGDYYSRTFWFECPQCGAEVEEDEEPPEPEAYED